MNVMEGETMNSEQKETITFTIEKISTLTKPVLSCSRLCQNVPWKIIVKPVEKNIFGIFLQCCIESETRTSRKWSCKGKATLKLLRHDGLTPLVKEIEHVFCKKENDWGYSLFISWKDLMDPSNHYVKDDKVTVQADFTVGPLLGVGKICEPCIRTGSIVNSSKYCTECRETFCHNCVINHNKFKLFIDHHIVDNDIASNKYFDLVDCCPNHKDCIPDFFCTAHEQLCCKSCIAGTHKSCDNIKPLEIVSKGVKQSSMYEEFQKEVAELHDCVEKFAKYRGKWITSKNDAKKHIRITKEKICKHFDDLEKQLLQKIESSKPVSDFDETVPFEDDVHEIFKHFEFISKHGSESQIFLLMLKLRPDISKNYKKIEDIETIKSSSELVFEDEDIISMIKSIGNINIKTEPCSLLLCSQKMKQAQVDTKKSEQ